MSKQGHFVWHEMITANVEAAKTFYSETIGWRLSSMDMPNGMTYSMLQAGETPVGGFAPPPQEGIEPHWVSYLAVDDVDATAEKVRKLGGTILMEAFDVPTVGRMQPVKDNQGAAFFLFSPEKEHGPEATGPGSFHWNELWVKDIDKAVAFYSDLLGYTHESMDMPDGKYVILKKAEAMCGGLMALPMPQAPVHWHQYVSVDDCDATVARAKRQGGQLLGEIAEVEGIGRFATIKDPQGAALGVIKPAS